MSRLSQRVALALVGVDIRNPIKTRADLLYTLGLHGRVESELSPTQREAVNEPIRREAMRRRQEARRQRRALRREREARAIALGGRRLHILWAETYTTPAGRERVIEFHATKGRREYRL